MLKKILVTDLELGMHIHEFCRTPGSEVPWVNQIEVPLDDIEALHRIQQSTVREVWIDTHLGKSASGQCPPRPAAPLDDTSPASLEKELARARLICGRAKLAVMTIFTEAKMGRAMNVADVDVLVEEISNSILRHPHALISLSRLKTSDEYTYMHSVAVCALMVALARRMGLTDEQVRDAGVAGLMHDVGKMMIDPEILNKPDRLTPEEFAVMKHHPEAGLKILEDNQQVNAMVLDVCVHHHEKIDGSGYPHGLAGDEISVYARMGAICDVYDAVTSERPYKKAWGAAQSIREMATWKGHFDEKVFQVFVKTLGIYPVGALVRLASGRLGIVVEQNEKSLLLPKVKVFMSTHTKRPIEHRLVNLANPQDHDTILKVECPEDWGITDIEALWCGTKSGALTP
ncbi:MULTISPECIES: HD-GYP domain-containing protein [Pseudomonas]|jgi:putative nucleotidyltransferase with HDIG domain|uniref:Metal-dependent phosphohydrolase n=1 Tax=Pseudomonas syringae TaxID=317 RepID=A0A085V724_PSESX|nr:MULTISPECIES: HD-GYP domain-containing protein [Pseudomonas]EPJ75563.1 HDIG domain protein [Pseudomonas sp. CFII64]KFE51237.1 metal-dependent phosphohydrolase [Pseudomonas syringae]